MRIGIVGTGRIADRFLEECKAVPEARVTAVYHPNRESAVFFAERHCLNEAEIRLSDDKEAFYEAVDAVYIAAPHQYHYAYARESLLAGKHVLCEKPICLRREEAKILYDLAQENSLVLMEALKTAGCPGFLGMLKLLDGGAIGRPYDVEACFTKIGSASGRELWGEYGGSFVELGSYPLLPIVRILGTQWKDIHMWSLRNTAGTDSYTKMMFSGTDRSATLKTGLGVKSEGELIVAGEKGYLRLPSPWWLTKKVEVHHEDPGRVEVYDFPFEGSGLRYEITVFLERIAGKEVESGSFVTPKESIWMAERMEAFLQERKGEPMEETAVRSAIQSLPKPRIWAHRGCSMVCPENTLPAFLQAARIEGITGIELDIQLTKDGELVVIHDETVDRTTNGSGFVRDHTLQEIKQLCITPSGREEIYHDPVHGETLTIPTLTEVLDLLLPFCRKNHLMINIELKNSVVPYEGMEEKVVQRLSSYGLSDHVIYSSFCHVSLARIKELEPMAKTGALAGDVLICLEGAKKYGADALHPSHTGMAINQETIDTIRESGMPVRMWNHEEPLFGQSRRLKEGNLEKYVLLGATDLITNVPEWYLRRRI